MASSWSRRRSQFFSLIAGISITRPSLSFVPPLAATSVANCCPSAQRPAVRPRPYLKPRPASSAPRGVATAGNDGSVAGDDEDFDELVGIDEFRAAKAERDREEAEVAARRVAEAGAEAVRAAAAASTAAPAPGAGNGVDLGLDGAIFPSDAFPGSPGTEDITLQGVQLESGQPQAMVGFWKLYGRTAENEDLGARVILRADGQVVGGPTVRLTPGVEWSDPQGLQPVGGRWSIYTDERTGRSRLRFTIVLSFQKKQQLEMNGVVLMVGGFASEVAGQGGRQDEGEGRSLEAEFGVGGKPQPQVFGGVRKRNGKFLEAGEGDFSMIKVPAGEDRLVATVGSQQQRIW